MTRSLLVALLGLCAASPATAQLYEFTINPASSRLAGPLSLAAQTTGMLIGDYDAAANPAGTRTKPGLFGTFGATENIPVPASLGIEVSGPIDTRTAGALRLDLDPGAGTVTMTDFGANFLHGGAVNIPVTVGLLFDSFRTRNPSSTYVGGFPLNLPIGEASLTQLAAGQVGSGAGVLTPSSANTYDFSLAAVMLITAEFSVLDNNFQAPGVPTPIGLTGSIVLNGATATLTSFAPVVLTTSTEPGVELPQFPLGLPTVLPPGATANLLLDLTLTKVGLSFDGTSTLNATGVVVPAPGAGVLLLTGLALLGRYRRRTLRD
jgi:hypothetical protein